MNRQITFLYFIIAQIVFTLFWWIIKGTSSVGIFVSLIWATFLMVPLNVILINILIICRVITINSPYCIKHIILETVIFEALCYIADFYLIQDIWLSCDFDDYYRMGLIISCGVIIIMAIRKFILIIIKRYTTFFKKNLPESSKYQFHNEVSDKYSDKSNSQFKYGNIIVTALVMIFLLIVGYHIIQGMYSEGGGELLKYV